MLTIMIPTKNRAIFLIRLLNYFASIGCKYRISIGDSSDAEDQRKTKEAIVILKNKLDIEYHEMPGLDAWTCYKQLISKLKTRYAVYMPDDDFLVPSGLQSAMDFLEKHPDFSGAHGVSILFSLYEHGPYGSFAGISNYELRQINEPTAAKRVSSLLNNYSVILFSVFRSSTWRLIYDETQVSNRAFKEELLPCSLAVVFGKIKQLDNLFLVRQGHDQRYVMSNWFNWITSRDWNSSYRIFCDILSKKIAQQDGIPIPAAEIIANDAFCQYLGKSIVGRQKVSKVGSPFSKLREIAIAKKISYVKQYIEGSFADKISLPAILNPRFKFHKDFLPIYRAVAETQFKEQCL